MSDFDKTIPIGGAWVMVIRPVPVTLNVPVLSIWYAMPSTVFCADEQRPNTILFAPRGRNKDRALEIIWRERQGGRLEPDDYSLVRRFCDENLIDHPDEIELVMKVRILTPEGSVHLMPHEYQIVSDIDAYFDMIDGEHLKLMELGGIKAAKKLQDILFYCRSRGISRLDALKMAAGTVRRQNVFYLQLHEAYGEYFGLVETSKYTFIEGETQCAG